MGPEQCGPTLSHLRAPCVGTLTWSTPQELPPWIVPDEASGLCRVLDPRTAFYGDCPDEVAAAATARLVDQSLASFFEPVSAAAWREKPSAYLICDDDQAVPPPLQEQLAAGAEHVEHVAAGHSPFLSQPRAVEAFLQRAVEAFARIS